MNIDYTYGTPEVSNSGQQPQRCHASFQHGDRGLRPCHYARTDILRCQHIGHLPPRGRIKLRVGVRGFQDDFKTLLQLAESAVNGIGYFGIFRGRAGSSRTGQTPPAIAVFDVGYDVAVSLVAMPFILGLGSVNPLAFWLSVVTGIAAFALGFAGLEAAYYWVIGGTVLVVVGLHKQEDTLQTA